ncbi:hypothetical protein CDAR_189701 [Caerostris darwini]|uniref:Uncharacterized protein n=1 Tax=Caerostris darwini TaxID=1538125 RepID=A0AAV4VDV8_9ARAC|nr:hypothetical protein CDAR_189701 [Caerostris darwini]
MKEVIQRSSNKVLHNINNVIAVRTRGLYDSIRKQHSSARSEGKVSGYRGLLTNRRLAGNPIPSDGMSYRPGLKCWRTNGRGSRNSDSGEISRRHGVAV